MTTRSSHSLTPPSGRFFGDHTSNLSVFGCKYRYLPDRPHLRRLIRGSVCGKPQKKPAPKRPSIHFQYPLVPEQAVISRQFIAEPLRGEIFHTHIHTYSQFRVSNSIMSWIYVKASIQSHTGGGQPHVYSQLLCRGQTGGGVAANLCQMAPFDH